MTRITSTVTRTYLLLALSAALLALPAVWVLLAYGLPALADDTPVHLMRLYVLDQHVRTGDWLPRWLPELYTGFGYPLFNFYAPAMYYAAEWLHLAGLTLVDGYRMTYVFAVIAGAVGAAFLGAALYTKRRGACEIRREGDRGTRFEPMDSLPLSPSPSLFFAAGLLTATAYTYTLYLLVNVYVRGALGEIGAQALLPWLFWAYRRLFHAHNRAAAVVLCTVLLAGLIATHTISFLLTLPVLLVYLVVLARSCGRRGGAWRTVWPAGASLLLAALLGAAVWLPQALERGDLSVAAYSTARMLDHLWRWQDFVNLPLRLRPVTDAQPPYQVGAVQALLLVLALLFTCRRGAEWWFWVAVLGAALFLMSPAAAPLWGLFDVLAVIQFPWRLLGLVGLAAALITGGLATSFRTEGARAIGVGLLILFIVLTQTVRAVEIPNLFPTADMQLSPASVARAEASIPALGAGYDDEFLPRWADPAAVAQPAELPPVDVAVQSAHVHADSLGLDYAAAAPFALGLRQFYFPGWQAATQDGQALDVAPSAGAGLVTAQLAASDGRIELARTATPAQCAGLALTVVGLLALAGMLAFAARRALLGVAIIVVFAAVIWWSGADSSTVVQHGTAEFPLPVTAGLDLLDVRVSTPAVDRLTVAPAWFIHASPPDLLAHWQLVDESGTVVAAVRGRPRYDLWNAAAWRPGEVVLDAVELGRPFASRAGTYQVLLELTDAASGEVVFPQQPVMAVELPAVDALTQLADAAGAAFATADGVRIATLESLQLATDGAPMTEGTVVARPGDTLQLDLAWQLDTPDVYRYQSFVQIVDSTQKKVASRDLQTGDRSAVLDLWNPYLMPSEQVALRLPDSLPGGLYALQIGVRDRLLNERLFADSGDDETADVYSPLHIKVVAPVEARPQHEVTARIGDSIRLDGYSLSPGAEVQPGDMLTVTLFYTARGSMTADSTRFLQLYDPAHGMAAQADAMPQNGANPTSSWVKGERIADQVVLHVAPDAAPGSYQLLAGFYDAANGGERLPTVDAAGRALPDRAIPLASISVIAHTAAGP